MCMERPQLMDRTRAGADARLAVGTAAGTVIAFGVFVLWPMYVTDPSHLLGLDPLWAVAGPITVLLGPFAAGMAGYLSFAALWVKGAELSAHARRMHLVTLLIVAGLFAVLVSPWGSDVISWWFED